MLDRGVTSRRHKLIGKKAKLNVGHHPANDNSSDFTWLCVTTVVECQILMAVGLPLAETDANASIKI
jgi:hypothetical protein